MEYVAGFLFDLALQEVVLIRKRRPAWQYGRLNGVGGKIEQTEEADEAMRREFLEETSQDIDSWTKLAIIDYPEATVHYFAASSGKAKGVKSTGSEAVIRLAIDELHRHDLLEDCRWLVPFAYYRLSIRGTDKVEKISICTDY